MEITITSDANSESGVGDIVDQISGPTYEHFLPRNYGSGLGGICVVIVCRDPELKLRRRVRFSRQERIIYADTMLKLEEMVSGTPDRRKDVIRKQVVAEIPALISKYSVKNFEAERFIADFANWLAGV